MNDIRQRAARLAERQFDCIQSVDDFDVVSILRMVAEARDLSGDDIYGNAGTPIAEGRRVLVISLDEEKP